MLQNLRGPDHGQSGRFAQPQHLLLELRHPLVAGFDGQVTAGDHHSHPGPVHGGQEDLGEPIEGADQLDLEQQAQLFGLPLP